MNWRQHLIFSPELPPISHEAEDLIKRYHSVSTKAVCYMGTLMAYTNPLDEDFSNN